MSNLKAAAELLGPEMVERARHNILRDVAEGKRPKGIGETVAFGIMCEIAFGERVPWEALESVVKRLGLGASHTAPALKDPPPDSSVGAAVYTVEEARRLLGIGKNAMYDGLKAGAIPSIRIGRSYRIPKAKLHAMMRGDQ